MRGIHLRTHRSVVLKSGEADAAAIATGTESFPRAAKVLDAQLKAKKFVTGNTLTLAGLEVRRNPQEGRSIRL